MDEIDIKIIDDLIQQVGDQNDIDSWNRIKEQKEKSDYRYIENIDSTITIFGTMNEENSWYNIKRWITENKED